MHGQSKTSAIPHRIPGSPGAHRISNQTTAGTTTKLTASSTPRNRRSRSAAGSAAAGTCRKVTNSRAARSGRIAGSSVTKNCGATNPAPRPTAIETRYSGTCRRSSDSADGHERGESPVTGSTVVPAESARRRPGPRIATPGPSRGLRWAACQISSASTTGSRSSPEPGGDSVPPSRERWPAPAPMW